MTKFGLISLPLFLKTEFKQTDLNKYPSEAIALSKQYFMGQKKVTVETVTAARGFVRAQDFSRPFRAADI